MARSRWRQSWRPTDGRRCWIHLGGKPSVNTRPSRRMPFSVAAGGKSSLLAERTLDRCLSKHSGCLRQSASPAERWNSFISQRHLTVSFSAILLLQAYVFGFHRKFAVIQTEPIAFMLQEPAWVLAVQWLLVLKHWRFVLVSGPLFKSLHLVSDPEAFLLSFVSASYWLDSAVWIKTTHDYANTTENNRYGR